MSNQSLQTHSVVLCSWCDLRRTMVTSKSRSRMLKTPFDPGHGVPEIVGPTDGPHAYIHAPTWKSKGIHRTKSGGFEPIFYTCMESSPGTVALVKRFSTVS